MEKKKQWHPAFCSAIQLELIGYKEKLGYLTEHTLNTKPIQIDLLVIKKDSGITIQNDIGKIFRGHNIMEYKSPEDELNVDTYFKILAYACLYKAQAKTVNGIRADDISISMIRKNKPIRLLGWFQENNYLVEKAFPGIYYILKEGFFPLQIIVSGELDKEVHTWLTSLASDLSEQDARKLIDRINLLTEKDEKEYADSVLQVSVKANRAVFEKVKEDGETMCEALLELMEPEINQIKIKVKEEAWIEGLTEGREVGRKEGRKEGREEGRKEGEIHMCLSLVKDNLLSISEAAKRLNWTEEEVRQNLSV